MRYLCRVIVLFTTTRHLLSVDTLFQFFFVDVEETIIYSRNVGSGYILRYPRAVSEVALDGLRPRARNWSVFSVGADSSASPPRTAGLAVVRRGASGNSGDSGSLGDSGSSGGGGRRRRSG